MDELLEQFLIEGRELVEQATGDLAALRRDAEDRAHVDSLFRAVHTLKGSVALFDFTPMGHVLHTAEDLLGAIRSKKVIANAAMMDALLACIDASERWIEEIARTEVLPAGAEQEARAITEALLASQRADGMPPEIAVPSDWLADFTTRHREIIAALPSSSGPVAAIRYVPDEESFLLGEDPLLLVRAIPELAGLAVSQLSQRAAGAYDAYSCNLLIEAISLAPIEEIKRALSPVLDQVAVAEDIRPTLSPAGEASRTLYEPALAAETSQRTVRVDAERLDALVDLVGELIVAKNSLGHVSAMATGSPVAHALAAGVAGLERLTGDMHRTIMRMRMTPLAKTFGRFPRWMRETAAKLGKDVDLQIKDNGTEADKTIVDGIFEPLLHVLRNALDHGVESGQARQAAGKSARGQISLEARQHGDQIIITVTDDGAGIDLAAVRRAAKQKSVLSDAAIDALDDAAAADLIFMPGFSTARTVSDISGRGVGMDSVRTTIMGLGGRVTVDSKLGSGTTIQMALPQAIVMSTIVTVDVGKESFGIPIDVVAETCRVPSECIHAIRDGEAFVLRSTTLPLVRLSELLRLPGEDRRGGSAKVLVVSSGGQRVGVEVDGVRERLDVLLRPMTGLLSGMPGVVGSALLGDGRVMLVLDIPELLG